MRACCRLRPRAPKCSSVSDVNNRANRRGYYTSLRESQQGWHEHAHTIWPWISYLANVLADAYEDFERRVAAAGRRTGSKQERVREHVLHHAPADFRRRDIERALPGISPATIRLVLNELRNAGQIAPEGSGPGARWHRR